MPVRVGAERLRKTVLRTDFCFMPIPCRCVGPLYGVSVNYYAYTISES